MPSGRAIIGDPARGKRRTSIGPLRNPDTEAAVLSAARELVAERGYAGFTFDEVARRAGARKSTIYRWYPTKADLFIAIYDPARSSFVPIPQSVNLIDDLVLYTTNLWRFWETHRAGAALRGLIAEAQGNGGALIALRERFLRDRTADLKSIFSAAAARGEISARPSS